MKIQRSLNAKLLLMLMLVALFTSITTTVIFSVYELNSVTETEKSRLNGIANILAPNLTAAVLFQDEYTVNELIKPLLNQSSVISAAVFDSNGNMYSQIISDETNKTSFLKDILVINTPLEIDGTSYGKLVIKADYSMVEKSLVFFGAFLFGILIVTLLLSFLLSLILRKKLIHPLLHLTTVAEEITETNKYSMRAEVLSDDEVGDLALCFNSMLETIEQREHILEVQVQHRTNALKQANNQLTKQANSDPLSGLPNRRYILDKLSSLISDDLNLDTSTSNALFDNKFAILGLDLDGFKEINDTLGHDSGDLLLIAVSKRISSILPDNAMVARLGGDEFIVLIENLTTRSQIEEIVNEVQQAITNSFVVKGKLVYVTTSIGIAIYPDDGLTVEKIVKYADIAMYKSKEMGRNCHHFFHPDLLNNLVQKRQLIDDLRSGLKNNEFELYYQPIIDLDNDQVYKAEALLRWNHPTRGMVPPLEFIPVAEETGIILELGEWIARSAAADLADIRRYAPNFQISINVSPLQFKGDGTWMINWFGYMSQLGLSRDAIIVEITENLLMESEESMRQKLIKLKEHGTRIAIDDFGVGYSSLSYLQKMDVDFLKIDKSFVDEITNKSNSLDLCCAMIMMARHLNIQVIAEGIETKQQKQILADAGCKFGQGYLFAKPLPLHDFKNKFFLNTSNVKLIHSN
ncbi:EAL domain-containing protein [Psychromonas sp. PT13]|uniref:EAL domain-containing protein n=1 Tax=Psychromonas sp. PT13 TaxID=3439547 RepID=UPI003EBB8A1C